MIKISVEKYCENCPNFEVEQDTNCAITSDGRTAFVEHLLECKHKYKCKQIRNYLEQSKINIMQTQDTNDF